MTCEWVTLGERGLGWGPVVSQRGLVDGPGTHGRGPVGAGGSQEPSGALARAFTDCWVRA